VYWTGAKGEGMEMEMDSEMGIEIEMGTRMGMAMRTGSD